nr:serine/arginine repetitive matrix protein 1-like isoform X1 [Vanessa tameamea]
MSPVWIVLALLPILGGAQRFNCRGRILGAYYADAKSGCKAFHVCVRVAGGGVRDFRFFCPPGTLFHQEAQTCTDWGDDDALACPADIYDGQFDLYKIGSGFDTKKVPSSGNREEEPEFGLQKAETGDRRLSQNSDLRAAHSSDFFTGQRDRGRDESATQTQPPISSPTTRQSFRRATTSRVTFTTTPHTTTPPPPPKPSNPAQYDHSKRKLVRKRPVHTPTPPPTTSFQNTFPPQTYSESSQQNFNRRNPPQNKQSSTTVNIPAQYKDEYVEVSKVTPKQNINRYYPNSPTPTPFSKATQAPAVYKKENPVELYNYNDQSTPGLSKNNDRPFKLKNSFNVQADVPKDDFARIRNFNGNNNRGNPTSTVDYNIIRDTSTPAYKNINSVSYDSEKNNFGQFLGPKQSHFNNPTSTSPTTTYYTTTRIDPPANLNTVAYNTNIGFNTQSSNYAESNEDDGQYRPPQGEDDGQYRPELYERDSELLSGAHSLNIAASGNRLPEDQKQNKIQSQKSFNKISAPRPFRPAPTPSSSSPVTEFYPTTVRLQTEPPTQRTFDYYQTYTTTSRPYEAPSAQAFTFGPPAKQTTLSAPKATERYQSRETAPPTSPPSSYVSKSTRPPYYAKPSNKKEDNSYDYAYYDSDPGFSEYDHIEEFGRTKTRV